MRRKLVFFAAAFCSTLFFSRLIAGAAEEPQLVATVDKQRAHVNEEIHLNIKITGARGAIQAPVLPSLDGFQIFYSGRASRFSFVNGRGESLTEFNYVLIPRTAGKFVIHPIEVKFSGRSYKTEQLEIEILAAQQLAQPTNSQGWASPPQASQNMTAPNTFQGSPIQTSTGQAVPPGYGLEAANSVDSNIFLRSVPSKLTVFTNEQLILDYSIFTRYDTRYEGFEEEPETSGFWIEEFPIDYQNIGRQTEMVNGRKFVRADIKKLALFPTAPGSYVIKPGRVKTSVQIQERSSSVFDQFFSDSFFSGSGLFARRAIRFLTAAPISILVRALPEEGKPVSFKGAVGEFRMSTDVDKRSIAQNEAVTLKIVIEGQGNIETLSLPEISEPANTKLYESDSSSQLYRQQEVVAGNKSFEVIFIPSQAGELVIEPFEFSFFNPRTERYVTLRSETYRIQVKPSQQKLVTAPTRRGDTQIEDRKKEIQLEEKDIQYIKEERSRNVIDFVQYGTRGLIAMNSFLTLMAFTFLILNRRTAYLDRNVSLKRRLIGKKIAQKRLRALAKMVTQDARDAVSGGDFFAESAKVLNEYLAGRLNMSAHGMTTDLLTQALRVQGESDEVIERVQFCYGVCNQARFGNASAVQEKKGEVFEAIRFTVQVLEK
jgi:hypothetical protein